MERRHTRRLVRYWVFLAIAYLLGLGFYFYYGTLHTLFSAISASVGMIGSRYLMSVIALYYLTGFVLGIIFLGFDVRARDIREGIVEVLDSRPLTNLELVIGRFIALFFSAWIPIVVLVVLIQGLGWLLPLLGSPIGRTVEPWSLVGFVFVMALPAIAFAIALVFFVTLLVRHRLFAALLSIAAIVGLYWTMFTIGGPYVPAVDFLGSGQVTFPSDIVPGVAIPGGFLQRFGVLVLSFGLLGFAAVVHPRLDGGGRARAAGASAALVVVGLASVFAVTLQRFDDVEQLEQWRMAHEARADESIADMLSIEGSVSIDPGQSMEADLQLVLRAPPGQSLDRLLLTLNPGFVIDEVSTADGQALNAGHVNGLLDIELAQTLVSGNETRLNLRYSGRPHTGFGYLDSAVVLETANLNEGQIAVLGYERGLFDSRFVALMPGIHWLPASGVDVGRDDSRSRGADYFDVAIDVEVPGHWYAAGPGKRQVLSAAGDRATFRFAPRVSVPQVALMASEFESFTTEIEGIEFEILVHPEHTQNFTVFADARAEVEQWVAERIEAASSAGISYPFDAFTIVEVPNTLRSYEGGWRLDTALAQPGMMLLRETSFPTARFDYNLLDSAFVNLNRDAEASLLERDRLVSFFSNDFSGGNLFTGAARSFFAYRTSAIGAEAIALDFALEELATLFISGQRSYFSVHLFSNINASVTNVITGMQGQGVNSVADALITVQTGQTEVWEAVLDSTLANLDPAENPQRTIDILTLKGGKMAEAIYDTLGPNAVGELLANLLANHAGASYSLDDLITAGASVDDNLGPLFDDWFSGVGLPGFLVDAAELYRLPDSDSGDTRYQLLLRVINGEPVTGFTRVAWTMSGDGDLPNPAANLDPANARALGARTPSEPIRIAGNSAIEFGVVLSEPASAVYLHPYLSLNREDFLVDIFTATEIPTRDVEPLNGVREVATAARNDDRIIADDLDESFAIVSNEGENTIRLGGRDAEVEGLDQGLPSVTGNTTPRVWSRRNVSSSWGRYRHTLAYMAAGDGTSRAVMPVTIPAPGIWELEIHQPFLQFVSPDDRGTWNLEIVSEYGRESIGYDATVGIVGWNLVGEYDLPAGEVRVEISDATDGTLIVADAIAWSPVRVRAQPIPNTIDAASNADAITNTATESDETN